MRGLDLSFRAMPSSPAPRSRPATAALVVVVVLVVAACSANFDPSSPCTSDGRAEGAYPSLEAMVPRSFVNRTPDRVDSGRNCTATALGALADHGVTELRFAGSTWGAGPDGGVTIAIFDAPGLKAEWVRDFYKAGADAGRNTEAVTSSTIDVDGGSGYRVDTLNGESFQTVVDWQDGARVRVVLVASFIREVSSKAEHEKVVAEAIATAVAAQDR